MNNLHNKGLGSQEYKLGGLLERIMFKGISSENKIIRGSCVPLAFYYAGPLFGKGREIFAEQIYKKEQEFFDKGKNIRISKDARLTKDHALWVGIVGMSVEGGLLYFGGQEVKQALIPETLSTLFDISYNAAVALYCGGLGVLQNYGRIAYAEKKNKGTGLVGILPLVFNADYHIPRAYRIAKIYSKKAWRKIKNNRNKKR